MEKLLVPTEAAAYVAALKDLIKTGAAAAPGLESSCLLDLPVVLSVAGASANRLRRAHTFLIILERVIMTRLTGLDCQTGRLLFGLSDESGRPAQERYRDVAKLYNPHWTWENFRKEPLTRHLLAVYYALRREVELVGDEPTSTRDKPAADGLIGQDWALDTYDGLFILPEKPGQPLTTVHTRTLRCLVSEAQTFRYRVTWRERGNSQRPRIKLRGRGSIKMVDSYKLQSSDIHLMISDIVFPKPVKHGDTITFTLLTTLDVDYDKYKADVHDWYGMNPTSRSTRYIRVAVHVPSNLEPKALWRQQDLVDGFSKASQPTPDTLLTLDENNYAEHEWHDAPAGYSYGIAIKW